MQELTQSFFARPAHVVARALLGARIVVGQTTGIIVETESYADDAASHGRTRTNRSALMHDTFGRVYVYFVYGVHYCLNITTTRNGPGAVLIRALEPLDGIELMRHRRHGAKNLASGPGNVCQALGITTKDNGVPLGERIRLYRGRPVPNGQIVVAPRVGISVAAELPLRFFIRGDPFVSKPN